MSTMTSTRTTPRLVNDGDKPVVNHWNRLEDITRSIVTGESILAMCGFIGPVQGRGNGSVAQKTKGVLIVCEPCKRAFEGLSAF